MPLFLEHSQGLYIPLPLNGDGNKSESKSPFLCQFYLYIPLPLNGDGNDSFISDVKASFNFTYLFPSTGMETTSCSATLISTLYIPLPLNGDGNFVPTYVLRSRCKLYIPLPLNGDGNIGLSKLGRTFFPFTYLFPSTGMETINCFAVISVTLPRSWQ